jgi:hypothetical protein
MTQQRVQGLVVLLARATAFEVRAHPGHGCLGVGPGKLQLNIDIELLKAGVTTQFGSRRPEDPLEQESGLWFCGHGDVSDS